MTNNHAHENTAADNRYSLIINEKLELNLTETKSTRGGVAESEFSI